MHLHLERLAHAIWLHRKSNVIVEGQVMYIAIPHHDNVIPKSGDCL
jgi:hypothetical protein